MVLIACPKSSHRNFLRKRFGTNLGQRVATGTQRCQRSTRFYSAQKYHIRCLKSASFGRAQALSVLQHSTRLKRFSVLPCWKLTVRIMPCKRLCVNSDKRLFSNDRGGSSNDQQQFATWLSEARQRGTRSGRGNTYPERAGQRSTRRRSLYSWQKRHKRLLSPSCFGTAELCSRDAILIYDVLEQPRCEQGVVYRGRLLQDWRSRSTGCRWLSDSHRSSQRTHQSRW